MRFTSACLKLPCTLTRPTVAVAGSSCLFDYFLLLRCLTGMCTGNENSATMPPAARNMAWRHGGIDFRTLEDRGLAPNMPVQGVPYDLVDQSEGGAVEQLLDKLQNGAVL